MLLLGAAGCSGSSAQPAPPTATVPSAACRLPANPDSIEEILPCAMQAYCVPAAGYAIIDDYEIVEAETVSIDPAIEVTTDSIFQAASMSKPLTTYGLLKLVGDGVVDMDAPANDYIHSWQIPASEHTETQDVRVSHLPTMTSALAVSNFDGYPQSDPLPNLQQLLNGEPPANNPPITVLYEPGSGYAYSNGGFQTIQQIIEDVTERSFQEYMWTERLAPIGMANSFFGFPLSDEKRAVAVPAVDGNCTPIPDGWYNYAALAAAGMWTTPSDMATFAIDLSRSYLGQDGGLLPRDLARAMVTRHPNTPFGMGGIVTGRGDYLSYSKTGHTYGYQSFVIVFSNVGKGLVVMTASETGDTLINLLVPLVAQKYGWPPYFPFYDESVFLPDM